MDTICKKSTDKPKALFTALNSPGHFNSLLGIADILKKRGFETIFVSLGPMMMPTVQKNGHRVITIEDTEAWVDPDDNSKVYTGASKWPVIMEKSRKYFSMPALDAYINTIDLFDSVMTNEIKHYNDRYDKIIEDIDPQVIVIDNYFIPPCIVTNKRPWIRVYSANPLVLSTSENCPPPFGGFSIPDKQLAKNQPETYKVIKLKWDNFKRVVTNKIKQSHAEWDLWLQNQGCPPLSNSSTMAHDSPHLNLYMFPKCLDYDDIRPYPARWIRCDSMLRSCQNSKDEEESEMIQVIETQKKMGKKLIFFSMGSLASGDVNLMKNLISILSRSRHFFIVAKGTNGDKYELPDNMWGKLFLPQLVALSQVDMAIIHGGNNSLTECFYFGCPMIVMPVFADQLDNAQRVADKGFGQRFDPYRPGENELLKAVDGIVNNTILKNKMKEISEEMQAKTGASKGADLVEILTTKGSLDDETINRFRDI